MWRNEPMLAVDTETTGPDPRTARVVTATCALITPGQPTDIASWLINPGEPIPDEAAAVHGVTTEQAQRDGVDPASALAEIAAVITGAINDGAPVIAYNAAFDLTLLDREFTRHGIGCPLEKAVVIDPFVIWKQVDRYRKGKRTLEAACEAFAVRLDGAHNAEFDALAAARVAWRIAGQHPAIGTADPTELHRLQVAWKHEQATSLQQYFSRQGKTDIVDTEWPIIPARLETAA